MNEDKYKTQKIDIPFSVNESVFEDVDFFNTSVLDKEYGEDGLFSETPYRLQFITEQLIDPEWINKSIMYITNLDWLDKLTILGYSYRGDTIVNNYARGTLDWVKMYMLFSDDAFKPLSPQLYKKIKTFQRIENIFNLTRQQLTEQETKPILKWTRIVYMSSRLGSDEYEAIQRLLVFFTPIHIEDLIESMIEDMTRLIENAPPTSSSIILFRGIKDMFISSDEKHFTLKGFVSTSPDIFSALDFTEIKNKNNNIGCCIKRISVPVDSKLLFVPSISRYADEVETILSMDCEFLLVREYIQPIRHKKKIIQMNMIDLELTECPV
jgi:hypothetical protein